MQIIASRQRGQLGGGWKCFDLWRKKFKLPLRFVDGVLAQLVERLNGIQKVRSSSLLGSTISRNFSYKEFSKGFKRF